MYVRETDSTISVVGFRCEVALALSLVSFFFLFLLQYPSTFQLSALSPRVRMGRQFTNLAESLVLMPPRNSNPHPLKIVCVGRAQIGPVGTDLRKNA